MSRPKPSNYRKYWKAIIGALAPAAVVLGSAVLEKSDGGTAITTSEWLTALVAAVLTGGGVAAKKNAD
jgi:hypothetical protein